MKRKLFLGIGGSGCKVAELYSYSAIEKENIAFLGLDTDVEALERISNIPTISLTEYNSLGNVIDKIGKESISDWFPCDEKDGKVAYFRSLETGNGANGWRMKGLLSFEYMLLEDEKRRKLIGALEWLFAKEKDDAEQVDAEICIIASVCGGTGSAIAIAVSMFIKRYVKSVFDKSVQVKALLACPEIYQESLTSENKIKARANAYATFKEINAIDLVAKGYNQTAKELSKSKIGLVIGSEKSKGMGLLFDSNLPAFGVPSANPFDKVYIFNRVVGVSSISAHEQIMAKMLSVISDDQIIEEDTLYSTISISEVIYQSESVVDYVIKRKTFEELENEWLWLYNATKRAIDTTENNYSNNDSYVQTFAESIIETYLTENGASRFFEYLALNRANDDDIEYRTDSPEVTRAFVEDYVDKLVARAENLIDYKKLEALKKSLNSNALSVEQVKLFDSKAKKQEKSKKLYDFVEQGMKDLTVIHKQNIESLSENTDKLLVEVTEENSSLSIQKNILTVGEKHLHPIMALTSLCLLYNTLGKRFSRVEGTLLTMPYNEDVIPKRILVNVQTQTCVNVAYNSLAQPRLSTLLETHEQNISKEIIRGVDSIKQDIIDLSEKVTYVFVEKMLHAVYNKIGSLIEKYISIIESVKNLLDEHFVDVKIALLNDTSDTCTQMNVGCGEDEKISVYKAYAKTEAQDLLDSFAGKIVYDAVVSGAQLDLFNVLCEKRKEISKDNPIITKVRANDVFRVLHDKDLLTEELPKITKYNDFKKALSLVALPSNIDIKKDEEHEGIRVDEQTMVSDIAASFARQMVGNEKLTDQEAVDKYLFEQGNFEAKVTISSTLPADRIYSVRKISNVKPWLFNNLNDNQTGATYYIDYLKSLTVKEQQFTQMWNPHLVKEKVEGDYLPFINPERQIKFEKGVYKAILYMLDKGVLLVSQNQEKKDIICYKEAPKDAEPIIFEGKPVLFEKVYDLFGFARQNAELTMKYANLFDLAIEKECSKLEVVIYNDSSLPKIKQGILSSDFVKMLLGDMYKFVRSINKIEPKSLLDFIYDMSLLGDYKFETVNLVDIVRQVLTYMVKYRTTNDDDFEKLYSETLSGLKYEYEKKLKQSGVKNYKNRKEVVFNLFENK